MLAAVKRGAATALALAGLLLLTGCALVVVREEGELKHAKVCFGLAAIEEAVKEYVEPECPCARGGIP